MKELVATFERTVVEEENELGRNSSVKKVEKEEEPTVELPKLGTLSGGYRTKFPNRHVIGVTGGTASGKTSLCQRIGEGLKSSICILSLDSFYKGLT